MDCTNLGDGGSSTCSSDGRFPDMLPFFQCPVQVFYYNRYPERIGDSIGWEPFTKGQVKLTVMANPEENVSAVHIHDDDFLYFEIPVQRKLRLKRYRPLFGLFRGVRHKIFKDFGFLFGSATAYTHFADALDLLKSEGTALKMPVQVRDEETGRLHTIVLTPPLTFHPMPENSGETTIALKGWNESIRAFTTVKGVGEYNQAEGRYAEWVELAMSPIPTPRLLSPLSPSSLDSSRASSAVPSISDSRFTESSEEDEEFAIHQGFNPATDEQYEWPMDITEELNISDNSASSSGSERFHRDPNEFSDEEENDQDKLGWLRRFNDDGDSDSSADSIRVRYKGTTHARRTTTPVDEDSALEMQVRSIESAEQLINRLILLQERYDRASEQVHTFKLSDARPMTAVAIERYLATTKKDPMQVVTVVKTLEKPETPPEKGIMESDPECDWGSDISDVESSYK